MAEEKGQGIENPQDETGQGEETPPSETAEISPEVFLEKTGYKNLDEFVKSDKEKHATITKLSEEKKKLQSAITAQQQQVISSPASSGQEEKDFFDDPEGKISNILDQKLGNMKIDSDIERERALGGDVEGFDDLKARGFIGNAYVQNPELRPQGAVGFHKARVIAEGLRDEEDKQIEKRRSARLAKAKSLIESDGTMPSEEEIRQKILIEEAKARGATIPTTGGAKAVKPDLKAKLEEAKSKGDVKKVTDLVFGNLEEQFKGEMKGR